MSDDPQAARAAIGCPDDFGLVEWIEELKSRAGGSLEMAIEKLSRPDSDDGRRLDWLEKERPNIFCLCTWGGSTSVPNDLQTSPDGFAWEINNGKLAPTLRAAIDDAASTGPANVPPVVRAEHEAGETQYRELVVGEVIHEGDEYIGRGGWFPVSHTIGQEVGVRYTVRFRRPIPPDVATGAATGATPEVEEKAFPAQATRGQWEGKAITLEDARDLSRRLTAALAERDELKFSPGATKVGVMAIIGGDDGRILLGVKGRAFSDEFKGKLVAPGGRVNYGERLEDALRRECREEAGVEVEIIDGLPAQQIIHDRGHFVFAVFACRIVSGDPKAGDDLTDIVWVQEVPENASAITAAAMRQFRERETLRSTLAQVTRERDEATQQARDNHNYATKFAAERDAAITQRDEARAACVEKDKTLKEFAKQTYRTPRDADEIPPTAWDEHPTQFARMAQIALKADCGPSLLAERDALKGEVQELRAAYECVRDLVKAYSMTKDVDVDWEDFPRRTLCDAHEEIKKLWTERDSLRAQVETLKKETEEDERSISDFAKHLGEAQAREKELRDALTDMIAMIDEGLLVRDVSKDHDPDWALKQLAFLKRLKKAAALAQPVGVPADEDSGQLRGAHTPSEHGDSSTSSQPQSQP